MLSRPVGSKEAYELVRANLVNVFCPAFQPSEAPASDVVYASQINGCAYCMDMHTKDARARGETEQRLYLLEAWAKAPFYSDRERAALAWTEAVTRISETHVPDSVYKEARKHFTDSELVALTMAVITINGWNRLAISFRLTPGAYQAAVA
jgi:AhpD family alkylhydroperoxidase